MAEELINVFSIINRLPETLKSRAEIYVDQVREHARAKNSRIYNIEERIREDEIRAVQIVVVTFILLDYLYSATHIAKQTISTLSTISTFTESEALGFSFGRQGEAYTQASEATLQGERLAKELLSSINEDAAELIKRAPNPETLIEWILGD